MKTNHSSFSECIDVIKPLTAEEKEEMKKKFELYLNLSNIFVSLEFKNVLWLDVKNKT
jgi:hypothetical protein